MGLPDAMWECSPLNEKYQACELCAHGLHAAMLDIFGADLRAVWPGARRATGKRALSQPWASSRAVASHAGRGVSVPMQPAHDRRAKQTLK